MHIVTGERIQQLCDIYIGLDEDFNYNPVISTQTDKHLQLFNICYGYNNPSVIFCYTHRLELFAERIDCFQNPFTLVTHNSDHEIKNEPFVLKILNHPLLRTWFGQNVITYLPKLEVLPIGFANAQWPHGNLSIFSDMKFLESLNDKPNDIYFCFQIGTNQEKRNECYHAMTGKIPQLENVSPLENIRRLTTYQFCICPEGNGADTHRIWECLYLKVVPIVKKSPFINNLKRYHVPMLVLDQWEDLHTLSNRSYQNFSFDHETFLQLIDFQKLGKRILSNK